MALLLTEKKCAFFKDSIKFGHQLHIEEIHNTLDKIEAVGMAQRAPKMCLNCVLFWD